MRSSPELGFARFSGMGIVSVVALAVLALSCVFAATAGPREALSSRTQALRSTLAATSPLAKTISVTSTWSTVLVAAALLGLTALTIPLAGLAIAALLALTLQIRADRRHGIAGSLRIGE
jgi:hypothetical protein